MRRADRGDPRVFHRIHRKGGGNGERNDGNRGKGWCCSGEERELRVLALSVGNNDNDRTDELENEIGNNPPHWRQNFGTNSYLLADV